MASMPLEHEIDTDDNADHGTESPERPILVDLMTVGVYANSVWDLTKTPVLVRRARGVLSRHLERGNYPEPVLEGLRRALARGSAGQSV